MVEIEISGVVIGGTSVNKFIGLVELDLAVLTVLKDKY